MDRSQIRSTSVDKFIIAAIPIVILLVVMAVISPEGASGLLIVLFFSGIFLFAFRSYTHEKRFITNLFLAALAVRLVVGVAIEMLELREFFGGDAITYDHAGSVLVNLWFGVPNSDSWEVIKASSMTGSGWGMNYLVGFVYLIVGRNIFAAQCFCAVVGAATAPMVYFCANSMFENRRVGRYAAIVAGFFPAMIIWSSQLLKDGLIIFMLVLAMTMVIQLQKRVNVFAILLLGFSLFGILSLRFYIFYMVVVAVVGSFLVGASRSNRAIVGRVFGLVVLGIGLTYFGVIRTASSDLEKFGSLERIQQSRLDLARAAKTGFGSDADVSTPEGAIATLPIGLAYLMLAPFPWQATNLRQGITVPETFVWWAMLPLIISGLLYSIRHRLRNALPVVIFALMLTLSYAIFQGNVGTAYRQRTQIQVFLFIFGAVGLVIRLERREDQAARLRAHHANLDRRHRVLAGRQV